MASLKPQNEKKGSRIVIADGTLIPVRADSGILNAWRVTFLLALGILVFLAVIGWRSERAAAVALEAGLEPQPIRPYFKILRVISTGIPVTFIVTILGIAGSIVLGLLAGFGQISRITVLNRIAGVYVEMIRGIPLLVQLIFIYFALGKIFRLEGIFAAVIALSICYGAYMGEIFRAGIQAVPKGQMEAAIALGLTRGQALRHIILPQTMKIVLPAVGNEFIAMLKDSSLVSVLALPDLLRRGREYVSRTFQSLETYAVVALVYLVITLLLSRLVGMIEDGMKKHEK
jgi:polar amino acid transport system permease protein